MFLDATRFAFCSELLRGYATFRRELDGLSFAEFVPWPQHAAYEGVWSICPLFMVGAPEDLRADFAANRRRCPDTVAWLESIGRVRTACFSWLGPWSHVLPHEDAYRPGLIRAHVGLRVPAGALVRIAGELGTVREREVFVLDGQATHEVANLSAEPRVTLLVDVEMTAAEHDYVLAASAARRGAVMRHRTAGGETVNP